MRNGIFISQVGSTLFIAFGDDEGRTFILKVNFNNYGEILISSDSSFMINSSHGHITDMISYQLEDGRDGGLLIIL